MKTFRCTLEGQTPYSQSRAHTAEKLEREGADDYEKRTWRERCHSMADGTMFIPPMAFKNALTEAAQFMSEKIPGKRNATWTKHFTAGVLVTDAPMLPVKKAEVEGEWVFVNADGKKGSGTRVWRCYPIVRDWKVDVTFFILDETITREAFERHLKAAGSFIGIGRFRPRNGGFNGRFTVAKIEEVS